MTDYNQESLFVVTDQSNQLIIPDPNRSPLAVDVAVRAAYLQNVITALAAYNRAKGFIEHDDYQIQSGQRHANPVYRQNVEASQQKYMQQAKTAFLNSTGLRDLVKQGEIKISESDAKGQAREMFASFMGKFGKPENYAKAQSYRRRLVAMVDMTQENKPVRDYHQPAQSYYTVIEHEAYSDQPSIPDFLDTKERLKAIKEDPRARFYPATHREKNQVLTFLDYLNNPNFPLGIANQLIEVFNKSETYKRHNPNVDSFRGPLSITYELIDYLDNATDQLQALLAIQPSIHQLPNKRVSLAEERDWLELDHPGFRALVRYIDVLDFINGKATSLKDPLLTVDIESEDKSAEKHKKVVDIYTHQGSNPQIEQYINNRIRHLKVGEALDNIDLAILDQKNRREFMLRRLQDISSIDISSSRTSAKLFERPKAVAASRLAADRLPS